MKKLLSIVILGLMLSENAYATEFKYSPSDKEIKKLFIGLTVSDIINQYPSDSLQEILSYDNGVQYIFFIKLKKVSRRVPVICFVDSKSTACRVP